MSDLELKEFGICKDKIINEAYKIYVDVQNAWMDKNLEKVRNVLFSNLFSTYSYQIATLNLKNQKM